MRRHASLAVAHVPHVGAAEHTTPGGASRKGVGIGVGRVISGISSYRAAVWIQQRVDPDNTLGVNRVALSSLRRSLQRYRRLLPKSAFLPQSFIEDLVRGAEIDVDVMQELARLIVRQKQRITIGAKMECRWRSRLNRSAARWNCWPSSCVRCATRRSPSVGWQG